MVFEELINSGAMTLFGGGKVSSADVSRPLLIMNPEKMSVNVDTTEPLEIVAIHSEAGSSAVEMQLCDGADVSLTDVYVTETFAELAVEQNTGSRCEIVTIELCGANVSYRIDMNGQHAENKTSAVFVATESEHCTIDLTTRHNVSDCKSNSIVKGVAAGNATGEFRGLVFVAQDAQRTDAMQQSRNIEIGNAHIVTMPQLEIYADDVRCSHGATVGQLDDDAILYMRQRGLSEKSAQRLQIEGFINDVVNRCHIETIHDFLADKIDAKLEIM